MKGEMAIAVGNLMRKMWSASPNSSLRPAAIKKLIAKKAKRFSGYSQHDAQEFLVFLLDALHDDLNRVRQKIPYEDIKEIEDEDEEDTSRRWWENYEMRNDSHIKDVFCGQLRSRIQCLECGRVSRAFDPFMFLSLPIPRTDRRGASVELMDCFRLYTSSEELSGNDAYYCSRCKDHKTCTKEISIKKFPEVLILHLKRFSGFGRRSKLSTSIGIPTKGFSPYKRDNQKQHAQAKVPVYDLAGVVNHMGSLYSATTLQMHGTAKTAGGTHLTMIAFPNLTYPDSLAQMHTC